MKQERSKKHQEPKQGIESDGGRKSKYIKLQSLWVGQSIGNKGDKVLIEYKDVNLKEKTVFFKKNNRKETSIETPKVLTQKVEKNEPKIKRAEASRGKVKSVRKPESYWEKISQRKSAEMHERIAEHKRNNLRLELVEWIKDGRWGKPYNTEIVAGEKIITPISSEQAEAANIVSKKLTSVISISDNVEGKKPEVVKSEVRPLPKELQKGHKTPLELVFDLEKSTQELQRVVDDSILKLKRLDLVEFDKQAQQVTQRVEPEVKVTNEPAEKKLDEMGKAKESGETRPEPVKLGEKRKGEILFETPKQEEPEKDNEHVIPAPIEPVKKEKDEIEKEHPLIFKPVQTRREETVEGKDQIESKGKESPKIKVESSKKESWWSKKKKSISRWLNELLKPETGRETRKQTENIQTEEKGNNFEQKIDEVAEAINKDAEKFAEKIRR